MFGETVFTEGERSCKCGMEEGKTLFDWFKIKVSTWTHFLILIYF